MQMPLAEAIALPTNYTREDVSSPRFSGRRGLIQIWTDAKGTTIVYHRGDRSSNRLGYTRRVVHG